MNVILLSGGSGKRLWPLSNDVRSKQFLKLFQGADGNYESMIQRMYRQIHKLNPEATVTIATSVKQVSSIHSQLGGDVSLSVEPSRRDTFPAIVLAVAYLVDVMGIDPEEYVVVCPVDPYVEEDYFRTLSDLDGQARKGEAELVLLGMEPTYPSEKYGYILPETDEKISAVKSFREKPDVETARNYIRQGALWNGGVFAFQLKYVLGKAADLLHYKGYQDLLERYDSLPRISFDFAVVEKEPRIQVMRFSGLWKDLGTWNTLTEAMNDKVIGKGVMNDDCSNVHIVNEMDVPGAGHGAEGRSDFCLA